MKYMLIWGEGNIADEGNNKAKLIAKCRKLNRAGSVVDNSGNILFENKAQIIINNAELVLDIIADFEACWFRNYSTVYTDCHYDDYKSAKAEYIRTHLGA